MLGGILVQLNTTRSVTAVGDKSALCTPHEEYLLLSDDSNARQQNYRALFEQELDSELIDDIRKTTNKGMAIGNQDFIKEIEGLTGYNMTNKNRGRPKEWRKNNWYRVLSLYFGLELGHFNCSNK